MYADLHVHTYYSDGLVSPSRVFKEAHKNGVHTVAIADHDTVFHLKECETYAKKYGVELIKGVELSCYNFEKKKKVHILGLGITEESTTVKRLGEQVLNGRTNYHKEMINILAKDGYEIAFEDALAKSKTEAVFKIHLYMAIKDKYPEIDENFYKKYFLREDTSDVDLQMDYIDVEEGIQAIIDEGGVPILAHPNLYDTFPEVEEYISYGLHGIEIDHPLMEDKDKQLAMELAKKHNLIMSGGSDFHKPEENGHYNIGDYGLNKAEFQKFSEDSKIISFK